jgi:pimeloyl-ACP methyl ester carboxylesterase
MAPIARELAGAFRVLEPLQRLREEQPLTVATHIHDFHEVIAPRAKEPVHLVGSSWGAMLALACAAEHPRDVRSVVAIGCGTFDLRSRDLFKRRLGERMEDALKERIEDLEHQDLEKRVPLQRSLRHEVG